MTSFKYGGVRTVGALTIRANGLGTSSFQPTSQPARQSNSKSTDWPFCQPDKLQTQHSLANRSGISASVPVESLGLRRILRYYYSRPPSSTPTSPKDISPRSRPTESGSARAYPASASLRRFSPPPDFWNRHFFNNSVEFL